MSPRSPGSGVGPSGPPGSAGAAPAGASASISVGPCAGGRGATPAAAASTGGADGGAAGAAGAGFAAGFFFFCAWAKLGAAIIAAITSRPIRAWFIATPSASLRAITAENYWGKPPTAKPGGLYHAQIPDIKNEIGNALRWGLRSSRFFRACAEQSFDKFVGIELAKVIGAFAQTYVTHRDFELVGDTEDDPPLGCAIELGEHDA